jgi:hypothetical protein
MTIAEMQEESMRIVLRFAEKRVAQSEGMVILAMTLATTFQKNGLSKKEALNRFSLILDNVYEGRP